MNPQDLIKKYYHFAVVGVSPNKEKFGYKIFERLNDIQKNVYGISPIYDKLGDTPLYSCLEDVNQPIDIVVFVVNKKFVYNYIAEMRGMGIRYAWMQPGTYDDELLKYIKENGITPILACVLEETS